MIQQTDDHQNNTQADVETKMGNLNLNAISNGDHEESYFESANDFVVDAPPPSRFPSESNPSTTSIQQIFSLAANGAIPKTHKPIIDSFASPKSNFAIPPPVTMSSLLKHGAQDFTDASPAKSKQPKLSQNITPEMADILNHIVQGHRIMVIMRGPPGSGKSHLARALLKQAIPTAIPSNHICSADEFFTSANGQYNYDRTRLGEAHENCQAKVLSLASDYWSPIFVDNTNIHFWEMQPYFCIALQHNYLIRTLEPITAWRHSAGQLARKNVHGVPKKNIENMLNNFEPVVVDQVLRTAPIAYTAKMPQMRKYPQLELKNQPPPLRNATNTYYDLSSSSPKPKENQKNTAESAVQKNAEQKVGEFNRLDGF